MAKLARAEVVETSTRVFESGVTRTREADVRQRPAPLFELPRPVTSCSFATLASEPMRDAAPTLVEDPWFEEVDPDSVEVVIDETAPAPVSQSSAQSAAGWLGRYEMLCPVSSSATESAGTWLARQHGERGFAKLVSLLTLPWGRNDTSTCADVTDDARAAYGLRHPNACEILELGEESGVLFLATEWVHGVSMADLVRADNAAPIAMPFDIAAYVVAEACAGLHAAHEHTDDDGRPLGIVHRDVSLKHVLVTATGHVKVAGIGTARALARLEELDEVERTRAYPSGCKLASIAPEVVAGGAFDRRSDVFSLGAMLYEATTGVAPFGNGFDCESMDALLRAVYVMPSTVVPGFPAELSAIIGRALERDPVRRYATAGAMRDALVAWLASVDGRVTSGRVAELVKERAGVVLSARQDFVRELTAGLHASGVRIIAPPSSHSAPPASAPPASLPPMSYATAATDLSDVSFRLLHEAHRRERALRWALGLSVAFGVAVISFVAAWMIDHTPVTVTYAGIPAATATETATAPEVAPPNAAAPAVVTVLPAPKAAATSALTPVPVARPALPAPAASAAAAPKAKNGLPVTLPDSPY